jgi:hypothetical protein
MVTRYLKKSKSKQAATKQNKHKCARGMSLGASCGFRNDLHTRLRDESADDVFVSVCAVCSLSYMYLFSHRSAFSRVAGRMDDQPLINIINNSFAWRVILVCQAAAAAELQLSHCCPSRLDIGEQLVWPTWPLRANLLSNIHTRPI